MSGSQIGTVIGGAIGFIYGGPAGAQLGMAIGGTIGGIVDPTKINGPKIGDGQQQSATDGNPIAWVQGTAMVAGTLVQVSKRRQIRHKDSGKGGPTVVTYTAEQDFAILICESSELRDSTMSAVLMVMQDGKIVYDVRPGSTMLADSAKWKANVDFLFGDEDQLPHPTMEAITGVGNTPAYRGSLVAVFKNFDVSAAGDRIPTFQFVVSSKAVTEPQVKSVTAVNAPASPTFSVAMPDDIAAGDLLVMYATYSVPFYTSTITLPTGWTQYGGESGGNNGRCDYMSRVADGSESGAALSFSGGKAGWDGNTYGTWSVIVYCIGAGTWAGTPTAHKSGGNINNPQMTLSGGGGSLFLACEWDGSGPTSFGWPGPDHQIDNSAYGAANLTCSQSVEAQTAEWSRASFTDSTSATFVDMVVGISRYATPQPAGGDSSLQSIVSRICERGGLAASDIDTISLADIEVVGYPIARQANAANCLLPLLQAYFGYASEYDARLHFRMYGEDASVVVDRADLIEGNDSNNGAIVSNLRNQGTEFPRRIVASYMDPAQNYTVVDVAAERRSIDVVAIGDQSFQIPVVMSADDAAKAVNKALKVAYATLEGTLEYSVPFADSDVYIELAAGEPLQFQGKRYVLDEMILGNVSLKLTTRYDRQSAYTSNVQAITGNAPTAPISPYSGPTTLIPMNLPSLRPQDTYGVYLAAASADGRDSWRGCTVQVSYDEQQSWQNATQIVQASVFGALTVAEPTEGEPLTVLVNGDLESATQEQIAANANAFALLHAAAAEVGQFATATETATEREYELTELARAELGTTHIVGAIGDKLVMLESVYFLPVDLSFAGRTIYFRAIGFGEVAESATIVSLVYAPDTTIIHDGGTVT